MLCRFLTLCRLLHSILNVRPVRWLYVPPLEAGALCVVLYPQTPEVSELEIALLRLVLAAFTIGS